MKITLILTVVGSLLGFAYASVLGCESACSIVGSNFDTTVIGAFAGLIIALPINRKINRK